MPGGGRRKGAERAGGGGGGGGAWGVEADCTVIESCRHI